MTAVQPQADLDLEPAWIRRLDCGCVVAISCRGPEELDDRDIMDDFDEDDGELPPGVEETTVGEARRLLSFDHSRPPCQIAAERDRARGSLIALEQDLAVKDEALAELRALSIEWNTEAPTHDWDEEPIAVGLRRCAVQVEFILDALAARIDAQLFPTDEGGTSDE